MRKNKKGFPLMAAGLLLIAAALFLTLYNLWDERRAGSEAGEILEQIGQVIPAETPADVPADAPADNVPPPAEEELPAYVLNPGMEMPVVLIDGSYYIGVLSIPALALELPVMEEWSYPNLKTAPCRYAGSVYKDDMVIAGHNYKTHFGPLKNLSLGDSVFFTDTDGNVFSYRVVELETLPPTAVEDMKTGDWDLTLFTCTYGGQSRVTVRCEKTD